MSDAHPGSSANADPDVTAAVASAVATAPFVRLYGHADGDALAAVGLLAAALRDRDIPFQIGFSVDPAGAVDEHTAGDTVDIDDRDATDDRTAAVDTTADDASDSLTLVVSRGRRGSADCAVPPHGDGRPASVVAAELSHELGVDPDPLLVLAGVIASGSVPGADASGSVLERADQRGLVSRRPGVALVTADPADGLAHSTLLTAPFSGDSTATAALVDDVNWQDSEAGHRRLASLVAVEAVTADGASPGAADAVETALRPYATPTGPFETLGGYADVLSVCAREAPGLGVSVALGADTVDEALSVWRSHAVAAHEALASATTGRYEGVFVCRITTDRPAVVPTVARLASAFRSPEPVTLVVTADASDGERHAAVCAAESRALDTAMARVATEFDGASGGTPRAATLRVAVDDSTLIAAIREAL